MPTPLRTCPIRATTGAILPFSSRTVLYTAPQTAGGLFWNSILDTGIAEARATSAVVLIRARHKSSPVGRALIE
jgi:hypothetical protein